MHFIHSEWFQTLWLIGLLVVLLIWHEQYKGTLLRKFGDLRSVSLLVTSHSYSKERFKKALVLVVFLLLAFTLAQPQWGDVKKKVQRKGVEIIFLVDSSLSMLAEDVSPNRIEKAKLIMKSFLKQFKGDRVGIVTFARSAFIQSPLTLDYDAFLLFANSIQVGYIPDAGTSFAEAIQTAVRGFPQSKRKHHAIILLSDGEDLEGGAEDAIKMAHDANIRIYTIAIGTEEGAPIPLRSEAGKVSGYKKDRNGTVVITKLNPNLLKRTAKETGGLYLSASGGRETEWIYQHMQNLEKKEFKSQFIEEREDHFQFFLFLAIPLLTIESLVGESKKAEESHA